MYVKGFCVYGNGSRTSYTQFSLIIIIVKFFALVIVRCGLSTKNR